MTFYEWLKTEKDCTCSEDELEFEYSGSELDYLWEEYEGDKK